MTAYFFDTSVVVKRYITEPGSVWVRRVCDARDPETNEKSNSILIGEITIVEGAAAFAILVRRNIISKRDGRDAYAQFIEGVESEYQVTGLTRPLIRAAAQLTQRHPLKAYDAMQLAVGLEANDRLRANDLSLVFVSGDGSLLQAAQAEGLATENPFDHRDLDNAQ